MYFFLFLFTKTGDELVRAQDFMNHLDSPQTIVLIIEYYVKKEKKVSTRQVIDQ